MIPIPYFAPGTTIKSIATGGSRITDMQSDPPAPLPNGGYNFSGDYKDVLSLQAQYNATLPPLSVNSQGNLVLGSVVF